MAPSLSPTASEEAFRQRVQRVEMLVDALEHTPDPSVRAAARELIQTLLELHRTGLARLLEAAGPAVVESCARDELVGGLLLLHDLHPVDFETRVRQAVEQVRPRLQAHGADAELVGVVEGRVRLRLRGGFASSGSSLRLVLEEVLGEAAPDAVAVEIEDDATTPLSFRVSLPLVGGRSGRP
jgi:Fe-S cluster biogenesis protein NfuA